MGWVKMSKEDIQARKVFNPNNRPMLTALRKYPVTLSYDNALDGKMRGTIRNNTTQHCWDRRTGKYAGHYGFADYCAARNRSWKHGYDLINAPGAIDTDKKFDAFICGIDLAKPNSDTTVFYTMESKMNALNKPFDLEAAKAGKPICTRDGCDAKFITHVPDARPVDRVIVLLGNGTVRTFSENGTYAYITSDPRDLCMKQEPIVRYVKFSPSCYATEATRCTLHSNRPGKDDDTISIQKVVCEPGRFDK